MGAMVYDDNSSFNGDWRLDLRHGHGELVTKDGAVYRGLWVSDKPHGKGTLHIPTAHYTYNGENFSPSLVDPLSLIPRPHLARKSLPILKAIHAGVVFGSGTKTRSFSLLSKNVPFPLSFFSPILLSFFFFSFPFLSPSLLSPSSFFPSLSPSLSR